MMMPIVLDWARSLNVPALALLAPLSFATMLGGTLSLIGSSTNIAPPAARNHDPSFVMNMSASERRADQRRRRRGVHDGRRPPAAAAAHRRRGKTDGRGPAAREGGGGGAAAAASCGCGRPRATRDDDDDRVAAPRPAPRRRPRLPVHLRPHRLHGVKDAVVRFTRRLEPTTGAAVFPPRPPLLSPQVNSPILLSIALSLAKPKPSTSRSSRRSSRSR